MLQNGELTRLLDSDYVQSMFSRLGFPALLLSLLAISGCGRNGRQSDTNPREDAESEQSVQKAAKGFKFDWPVPSVVRVTSRARRRSVPCTQ